MIARKPPEKPVSIMLTPMIDMFTVILIFLIISYSPEQAKVKKTASIMLPASQTTLQKVSTLQLEVTGTDVKINGVVVANVNPSENKWSGLEAAVKNYEAAKTSVLLIADQQTDFRMVDRAVTHMARFGFGKVSFLTRKWEDL